MKTRKFIRYVMAGMAVASLALTACSSDSDNEPYKVQELTRAQQNIVGANNDFAIRAYNMFAEESEGNIVFSPQSIDVCMSMAAVLSPDMGVDGQGRKILDWLGCPTGTTVEDFCDLQRIIDKTLKNVDRKVTYESANNCFTNLEIENPDAVKMLSDYYDCSPTRYTDLRTEVNSWVKKQTHGKITELSLDIEKEDGDKSVLINALYFKGEWADKFKTSETRPVYFYNASRGECNVDAMRDMKKCNDDVRYMETDTYQTLFLAYGKGSYEMVVILPKERFGLDKVMKSITPEDLIYQAPADEDLIREVDIILPKFNIRNEFDLLRRVKRVIGTETLEMSTFPASSVKEIKHMACIEVDENGTTAAAVTHLGGTTAPTPRTAEFKADHPFAFAIREKNTGAIIMMGRVSNL